MKTLDDLKAQHQLQETMDKTELTEFRRLVARLSPGARRYILRVSEALLAEQEGRLTSDHQAVLEEARARGYLRD
jgi:hypothetical protein